MVVVVVVVEARPCIDADDASTSKESVV